MTFLLDTNVVSEMRRMRIDANVAAWVDEQDPSDQFISTITIMEIEIGILQLERRDTRQSTRLRRWLEELVLPNFDGRILPIDTEVALKCAGLHVPDPRPERDAMIAATALVHGLTMVTRNTADFAPTGVPLLNPWDERDLRPPE